MILFIPKSLFSIPMFGFGASGTIGKAITYGATKGVNWVRKHFIPENPQTVEQVNQRTALDLMVSRWQSPLTAPQIAAYNAGAQGTKRSGYALFMRRGLNEYTVQYGVTVTPVSVAVAGEYPSDVFTWSDV